MPPKTQARLLADALAAKGVSSVRIDKRGMFASAAAIPDPNKVTLSDYADDVAAWIAAIRAKTGASCVWVAGHSEGGLVALTAAQRVKGICGLILIATPGRPLGGVMREQFHANPANAPILPDADAAIDALGHLFATLVLTGVPRRIVLGGGVMLGNPAVLPRLRETTARSLNGYVALPAVADMESFVVAAALGGNAGPLGAVLLGQAALEAAATHTSFTAR